MEVELEVELETEGPAPQPNTETSAPEENEAMADRSRSDRTVKDPAFFRSQIVEGREDTTRPCREAVRVERPEMGM